MIHHGIGCWNGMTNQVLYELNWTLRYYCLQSIITISEVSFNVFWLIIMQQY